MVKTRNFRLGYISGFDDYSLGGAAISLALDRARDEGLMTNDTFSIVYKTNGCKPAEAMAASIELVLLERANVVFGPYCSPDNKDTYPTLVRCRPSYNTMGKAFMEIFKKYNWRRAIIFSQESSTCHYGAKAIYEEFEANGIKVAEWVRLHNEQSKKLIEEKVLHIKNKARVVILCHSWPIMETFMLAADRFGMTTSDYTYLHYQMSPDKNSPQPFYIPENNSSEQEKETRRRILAVFKQVTGAYLSNDSVTKFKQMLRIRQSLPPWNVKSDQGLSAFMALSDCTYLYLMVLDEITSEGGDTSDGRLIATKSKEKQFHGFTGVVTINDNADRIPDYWLWNCHPNAPQCKPFALIHLVDGTVQFSNVDTFLLILKCTFVSSVSFGMPNEFLPNKFMGNIAF
ncbi:hypothetical protein LSH36_54g03027 [Paralvinella palmiformis]|uniref:Receptor ligand binding region domain-containing protein n=1 Tax=Paralvinella palmiformis TaxID=53620 RepID=A0AAD9K5A3_9ANNE|nr:hypothetical protein LSH36_54g03027 [Paralvinella palmiformis]